MTAKTKTAKRSHKKKQSQLEVSDSFKKELAADGGFKKLEMLFKSQSIGPEGDYRTPGFVNTGPDMKMADVVGKMLHGSLHLTKKLKRVGMVVEYEDGSVQTILEVDKGASALDLFRSVTYDIPQFEHQEEHLWPELVEVRQHVYMSIEQIVLEKPSLELARKRGKIPRYLRA